MKVDLFTHFVPKGLADSLAANPVGRGALARWQRIPALVDLDAHFRVMDEFDDYVQIPSLANPPIEAFGNPSETPEIARVANDVLAELCAKYPRRFPGFVANLPMNNPAAAVDEAERAVRHLGAAGCLVYTNVLGAPLSDATFFPIFEKMAALDRPLWMHPMRGPERADYPAENKSEHELWFTFGWPMETALAMGRLVYAGLFDRLPGIKIVTHHLGGVVPYLQGKVALGFRQAPEGTLERNPVAEEAGLKHQPMEYFRRFYADTAVNGVRAALECGLEFFSTGHCVFASDAPFDPSGGRWLIREGMRLIDSLDPSVREQIYFGNAERLTGLRLA